MIHALRRATLRLSPVLRTTRLPSQTFSPTFCRCEKAQAPFTQAFTTSRYSRQEQEQAAPRDEDLSDRAHRRQVRKVTSGTSAQTLENDRPWHRVDSQADTGAGEADLPKKEDMTKGTLTGRLARADANAPRPPLDNTDPAPQANPTYALPPRTRTRQQTSG